MDFLKRGMVPIGIDADGRVWAQTTLDSLDAGIRSYRLTWTDDNGATWHRHRIGLRSECTEGGRLVACTNGVGTAVHLSLDRGKTWRSTSAKELVAGLPTVPRTDSTTVWQTIATPSGALVANVVDETDDTTVARVARRPQGAFSGFHLTPVRLTNLPPFQQSLTEAAGLLVANYPVAPLAHRPPESWRDRPIWLSYDEGRTWQKVVLNP